MIRDPSDGSVKEEAMPAVEPGVATETQVLEASTSGLPTLPAKASYLERLEWSRDWLREYRIDPEGVVRRMGEQGGENADGQD